MRYPNYPGVGKRIKARLVALDYVTEDGGPDIGRFIRDHNYDGRYFYRWANKDRTPTGDYLERLCADLDVSRAWLLFGEGPAPRRRLTSRPIRGGSGASVPPAPGTLPVAIDGPQVVDSKDDLPLIRRIATRLYGWWGPTVPRTLAWT